LDEGTSRVGVDVHKRDVRLGKRSNRSVYVEEVMTMLEPYLAGVVASLLGAIGYIFFWEEYKPRTAVRHLVLAVVAGIIYTSLRHTYGFPDFVVTVVVGWWAPDFIAGIATRLKPKPLEGD